MENSLPRSRTVRAFRAESTRRRPTKTPVACEPLEGRELLSMAHFGFARFFAMHGGHFGRHHVVTGANASATPAGGNPGTASATTTSSSTTGSDTTSSGSASSAITGSTDAPSDPPGVVTSGAGPAFSPVGHADTQGLTASVLNALTGGVGALGAGGGFGGGVVVSSGHWGGGAGNLPGQGDSGSSGGSASTLSTDLKKLHTDLQTIEKKSQVTLGQLATLRSDFEQISQAATSAPDDTKLTTLQNDIKSIGNQLPTTAQVQQLQSDFTAVIKSEGVTDDTLISAAWTDIQGVVTASKITADDAALIAADQKAIQTDLGNQATANGADSWFSIGGGQFDPSGSMTVSLNGPMGGFSGGGPKVMRFRGGMGGGFGGPGGF